MKAVIVFVFFFRFLFALPFGKSFMQVSAVISLNLCMTFNSCEFCTILLQRNLVSFFSEVDEGEEEIQETVKILVLLAIAIFKTLSNLFFSLNLSCWEGQVYH